MRVIVCGGRDYDDRSAVYGALDALRQSVPHGTLVVIQGGATGADELARDWCCTMETEYVNVPAKWSKEGKKAGPLRNQRMIDVYEPELVLAFPGGSGTADMVWRAENACIPVRRVCT